jgi:hypothetical protein
MDVTPVIPADQRGLELRVLEAAKQFCMETRDEYSAASHTQRDMCAGTFLDLHDAVSTLRRFMARPKVQNAGIATTGT